MSFLATNEPIGGFIAFASQNKSVLDKLPFERAIDKFIDLIKVRIKNSDVETVSNGLLEEIFELRIDAIEWMAENNENSTTYKKALDTELASHLNLSPHLELANALSKVFMIYREAITPALDILPDSFKDILGLLQKIRPTYQMFVMFEAAFPTSQMRYLRKWMDTSLQLEVGLTISHLVMDGQIEMGSQRISEELIDFLYNTISSFGAYSIFLEMWNPDNELDLPLINRIRILVAKLEMENNKYHRYSHESLSEILNN